MGRTIPSKSTPGFMHFYLGNANTQGLHNECSTSSHRPILPKFEIDWVMLQRFTEHSALGYGSGRAVGRH